MNHIDVNTLLQKINHSTVAVIREDDCIGCTKCIQACPFDSILGTSKLMHTVITDVCTGCELCVSPCPVDCIDVISVPKKSESEQKKFIEQSRQRFEKRNRRLAREKISEEDLFAQNRSYQEKKTEIQAILKRITQKNHHETLLHK